MRKTYRMSAWQKAGAGIVALLVGNGAAFVIPSPAILSLLTQATIFAVFALGLGVLLRNNGMVSFGHALYFGGTSYLIGILMHSGALSAELAFIVAIAIVFVFAGLLGLLIVRVPGVAFSMLTLAVGQMAFLTASRSRGVTGGADGMVIDMPSTFFGMSTAVLLRPSSLMIVSWTALIVLLVGLSLLLSSRFGDITEAVRDNEERARFIGLRTLLPRAAVYALSATVTAVGGALATLNTGFISPESLHWSLSGVALMMVVIGGTGVLWGPALGAAVYFFAKDILGDNSTHWMAIFGLMLIVIIVFAPEGLSGLLCRLRHGLRRNSSPAARAERGATATAH